MPGYEDSCSSGEDKDGADTAATASTSSASTYVITVPYECQQTLSAQVLAAAFGGVEANLVLKGQEKVHPFWLSITYLPLPVVQMYLFQAIKYDYNFVYEETSSVLQKVQVLLTVIIFITIHKEMYEALLLFVFCVNPTTWMDWPNFARNFSPLRRWIYEWRICIAIWPAMTLFLKVTLNLWWVVDESMSIIHESRTVRSAIFNSFALTFIMDLDETVWHFLKIVLHMRSEPDFQLTLTQSRELKQERAKRRLRFLFSPWSRTFEGCVVAFLLSLLFQWQYFKAFLVWDTGILSSARDYCILWSWTHEWRWFRDFMLSWYGPNYWDKADPALGGVCKDGFFFPTRDDVRRVHSYKAYWLGIVPVAVTVLLPQIMRRVWGLAAEWCKQQKSERSLSFTDAGILKEVEDELASQRSSEGRRAELVTRIQALEERLEQMSLEPL